MLDTHQFHVVRTDLWDFKMKLSNSNSRLEVANNSPVSCVSVYSLYLSLCMCVLRHTMLGSMLIVIHIHCRLLFGIFQGTTSFFNIFNMGEVYTKPIEPVQVCSLLVWWQRRTEEIPAYQQWCRSICSEVYNNWLYWVPNWS